MHCTDISKKHSIFINTFFGREGGGDGEVVVERILRVNDQS